MFVYQPRLNTMSFNDGFARNVIRFEVDKVDIWGSSSHTDNLKIDFLILGEGDTLGINGSLGASEKKNIGINFSKVNTKLCLSLHYNSDNSYLFINGKEIYKFKASNKK